MSRRAMALTAADLAALPAACRSCLFWEEGSSVAATVTSGAGAGSGPEERKRSWVSRCVEDGTPPGRVLHLNGEAAGYTLFAPGAAFSRRSSLVPRVSPDALQLATVWVAPAFRGVGLGRILVQESIKEALRLDLAAVEAYGDRRWRERACMLPVTWLLHEGFEVRQEHPRTPVLRLEARRTARWADSLEHAWEEVLGRLPRRVAIPGAEPAPKGVPVPNARSEPGDVPRAQYPA